MRLGKGWHDYGRDFEARIEFAASRAGLLLVKHGTQARYLPGGEHITVRSDLDYRLSSRQGDTAFFDAKSFANGHFTPSQIARHQLTRALTYQEHALRAGFVVELRAARGVFWYCAQTIKAASGSRLEPEQGLRLGGPVDFVLAPLFETPRQVGEVIPASRQRDY